MSSFRKLRRSSLASKVGGTGKMGDLWHLRRCEDDRCKRCARIMDREKSARKAPVEAVA